LYNVASRWLYLKEYINDARSHERQICGMEVSVNFCRYDVTTANVIKNYTGNKHDAY